MRNFAQLLVAALVGLSVDPRTTSPIFNEGFADQRRHRRSRAERERRRALRRGRGK